ncbi:hypothetical protein P280DRAFT_522665 [Massarina eburnea CBS 473.64]|uniref:Uncharacterized protein n=1 Tax=Massarina eburnea CBS 473.64 TaxID=1395130 RepID=A0A6A6RL28_9PLEO|nr:hypothetical protein P280DRAFT_522665 [Massarina eburnea CBS 473.64]
MFRTLALLSLATLALAAPVEVQGSKHVAYLASCAPDECPIGFCDPSDFNLVAAGYFANGPPKTGTATPTTFGTLSAFVGNSQWEGAKKTVRLGITGSLATNIQAGANKLKPSEIAGDAALTTSLIGASTEPFVCFRDGTTKFKAMYEGERYTCTADYYCPSLDLGAQ